MRPFGGRIVLYFTLVFLAGGGVGALATYEVVVHHAHVGGAESFRRQMIAELTKRLTLTPVQVKQLDGIFDMTRKEFGDFRESHKDEMHAIFERQNERILAILTPAQAAEFKKIHAEHQHEHEKSGNK
jgi:hypothetical protein